MKLFHVLITLNESLHGVSVAGRGRLTKVAWVENITKDRWDRYNIPEFNDETQWNQLYDNIQAWPLHISFEENLQRKPKHINNNNSDIIDNLQTEMNNQANPVRKMSNSQHTQSCFVTQNATIFCAFFHFFFFIFFFNFFLRNRFFCFFFQTNQKKIRKTNVFFF